MVRVSTALLSTALPPPHSRFADPWDHELETEQLALCLERVSLALMPTLSRTFGWPPSHPSPAGPPSGYWAGFGSSCEHNPQAAGQLGGADKTPSVPDLY